MKIPDIITYAARELRKNMTEAESVLWKSLKNDQLGVRFLRQKPIHVYIESNGFNRFIIADFFCEKKKLIIEIDGNIHAEEEVYLLDRHKEELLQCNGYTVIRIHNQDILGNILIPIEIINSALSGSLPFERKG